MKIEPTDALIAVDIQVDFCPGGALAVNEGDQVVPIINDLADRFPVCVFSRDWHPPDHCSFSTNPQFVDGSWPVHCVRDTPGAAFHPDLIIPADAIFVSKATEPAIEAYSDFESTGLTAQLKVRGVTRVFVCGLATDFCVKATALDARKIGFDVVLIEDACRAVDNPPGTGASAIVEMDRAGVIRCTSGSIW